jgi:hypothetical protein
MHSIFLETDQMRWHIHQNVLDDIATALMMHTWYSVRRIISHGDLPTKLLSSHIAFMCSQRSLIGTLSAHKYGELKGLMSPRLWRKHTSERHGLDLTIDTVVFVYVVSKSVIRYSADFCSEKAFTAFLSTT